MIISHISDETTELHGRLGTINSKRLLNSNRYTVGINILNSNRYTVGINIKFPYHLKKTVVLRRTNVLKTATVNLFTTFICSQFLHVMFRLNPPKSINEKSRSIIDGLERNWREEKRLLDEKSINNRRTEAERVTRRAETIDRLKRNGRLDSRNNRRTRAKRARRRAETINGLKRNGRVEEHNNRWTEAELATIRAETIVSTD